MRDFLRVLGSAAVLSGFEPKNSPSETEDAGQTMERYHFSVLQWKHWFVREILVRLNFPNRLLFGG